MLVDGLKPTSAKVRRWVIPLRAPAWARLAMRRRKTRLNVSLFSQLILL